MHDLPPALHQHRHRRIVWGTQSHNTRQIAFSAIWRALPVEFLLYFTSSY
jgi:hypothetical protein